MALKLCLGGELDSSSKKVSKNVRDKNNTFVKASTSVVKRFWLVKKCDMPVLPKAAVGKDVNPRRLADSPKGLNPDEWWALFHHKVSGDVLPDDVSELVSAVSLKQITEMVGDGSQGLVII